MPGWFWLHCPLFRQGRSLHRSSAPSHVGPVNPGLQAQLKVAGWAPLEHDPPLAQGLEAHSSMSCSHRRPVKPCAQLQRYVPGAS